MKRARCAKCQTLTWVNVCTRNGTYIGDFCADCFDLVQHDEPKRTPTGGNSGLNHNDPGFDNVIRALEEDR